MQAQGASQQAVQALGAAHAQGAAAGKGTTWSVVAPRVRYGRQRFSIVALDRAGNRQRHATTRTLTAKASHKRSKKSSKRH